MAHALEFRFPDGNYWLHTGAYSYEGAPYYSEFTLERALSIGWTKEELDALPVDQFHNTKVLG